MVSSGSWETQQCGSPDATGTGLETVPRELTPSSSVLSLGVGPAREGMGMFAIPRIPWSLLFYFCIKCRFLSLRIKLPIIDVSLKQEISVISRRLCPCSEALPSFYFSSPRLSSCSAETFYSQISISSISQASLAKHQPASGMCPFTTQHSRVGAR